MTTHQDHPASNAADRLPARKQPWVEPELQQLDLAETAANEGYGHDGGTLFADCTKS